jgi:hypothetical protein
MSVRVEVDDHVGSFDQVKARLYNGTYYEGARVHSWPGCDWHTLWTGTRGWWYGQCDFTFGPPTTSPTSRRR